MPYARVAGDFGIPAWAKHVAGVAEEVEDQAETPAGVGPVSVALVGIVDGFAASADGVEEEEVVVVVEASDDVVAVVAERIVEK